jgi:dipeptidyl-peptidase 4
MTRPAKSPGSLCYLLVFTLGCLHAVQTNTARAQGRKADYERADSLRERTRDKVTRLGITPQWLEKGDSFWYRVDAPGGKREYVLAEASTGEGKPAFDHAKVAESLGRVLGTPIKSDSLPIDRIAYRAEGAVDLLANGKTWRFQAKDASIKSADALAPIVRIPRGRGGPRTEGRRSSWSPRGENSFDLRFTAKVKNHNIILSDNNLKSEIHLTTNGTAADSYEPSVFWSPDSKRFVALKTQKADERKVYLVESTPKSQLQPKLSSYDYLKPGDKVAITRPHLFSAETGKEIAVKDDLFQDPWSIGDVHWAPDSSRFFFLFDQRGHQARRIVSVDAKTGNAEPLVEEVSKTFVDYSSKGFSQYFDKTNELLWMSERSGWNHLYLIDTKTGKVKNPITKGDWVVRGIDRIDEENRQIWFRAMGIHPEQDPYHIHFARVNFDGTGLVVLTQGDGTHDVEYSPDRRYYVDTYSRVDLPPVVELRRSKDGSLVRVLERADWSALLATGWVPPERFVAKGRDGTTDIYGVIYRPTHLDTSRKYPVIEKIYAGPQGAFVPKAFSPMFDTQELAELGFILVQIDGMGTNWRSKAFHDVCWKNLADAGFPDRILWLKAAAARYPQLDLSRVGVYGGSAGGQNAMGAVLFHPEFYKAAAADCGCHDNRMDKIWWNEAWMGKMGPHYAEQSNSVNAHRLQGKLLLTVGELDHNVDPASTMQVVSSLIKADKDFEFVIIPGADHGAGEGPYGRRRRRDFFVRHLIGVEPRS